LLHLLCRNLATRLVWVYCFCFNVFCSSGYICQEHNNPPDFFLDVLNADSTAVRRMEDVKSGKQICSSHPLQLYHNPGFRCFKVALIFSTWKNGKINVNKFKLIQFKYIFIQLKKKNLNWKFFLKKINFFFYSFF